jgi:drug/metabolite transporter (DMT)-like permease
VFVLGGSAALMSAFCYALASVFFRRLGKDVIPIGITILKSLIACVFTVLALIVIGDADLWIAELFSIQTEPIPFRWSSIEFIDFWLLFLSGLLGITIGDTAYFHTLNALGTRKTMILDTLSPSVTIAFAWVLLAETLSMSQFFGILLTLSGVGWVMFERSDPSKRNKVTALTKLGVMWGGISVLSHSLAYITAKSALENIPSMEASLIRQGTAMLTLVIYCLLKQNLRRTLAPAFKKGNLSMLLGASTCGSFLGIWLGLLGIKLIPVSIASTLNTTTPLFILPINRLIEKEHVSSRAILGAVIAFAGAAILLLKLP